MENKLRQGKRVAEIATIYIQNASFSLYSSLSTSVSCSSYPSCARLGVELPSDNVLAQLASVHMLQR